MSRVHALCSSRKGGVQRCAFMQNTGTKSCSMHLRPIRSPCISVKAFSPVLRLAPGMHVYIQIGYDSAASSAEPLDDEITVKYEGGSITIPVTLQSSSPRFQVSGELEWGMVCAGTDLVKQVQVVNSGTSSGTWTMRIESDCKMEVSPSSGDLQPGSSAEVTLYIPEIDPGELLCHLLLSSGDMALIHRYSITVQAVVATVELQGELGQPLHEVIFLFPTCHCLLVFAHAHSREKQSIEVSECDSLNHSTKNMHAD